MHQNPNTLSFSRPHFFSHPNARRAVRRLFPLLVVGLTLFALGCGEDSDGGDAPAPNQMENNGNNNEPEAPEPNGAEPEAPQPDAPQPDAPQPDAPEPDAPEPDVPEPASLCEKYGGPDNVATVVQQNVLGEIAGDCRVSVFFTALEEDALTHVSDCLTVQVQELFGCDGATYAGYVSSVGQECRDMVTTHRGLNISQGDFDAVIEDIVAGLQEAGVEQDDITAAAPALLGLAPDIVEDNGDDLTRDTCE